MIRTIRRIGVLGGSSAFTPALAAALAARAETLPRLAVTLHGRNPDRLEAVARFCNRHAAWRGADHHYRATTSVDEAGTGASVVVNQMRIGGWAGRVRDEVFPLAFDLPGDETVGPGGLASAVRSLPAVLAAARRVHAVAPEAWFVNMTNPMNILLRGLKRGVPGLRTLGLCELPRETLRRALAMIDVEEEAVVADYLGVNHHGWFVRLAARGRDLLPDVLAAIEARPPHAFFPVDPARMKALRALPVHYLRLYYHPERAIEALRRRGVPRGRELEALSAELYEHYAASEDPRIPEAMARRSLPWCEDTANLIRARLGGRPARLYVSSVNHGDVPGLPEDAIVERLATVDATGTRAVPFSGPPPVAGGPLEPFLAFLRRVIRFEAAACAAALEPDLEAVTEALRLHPLDIDRARLRPLAAAVLEPLEADPGTTPSGDADADPI